MVGCNCVKGDERLLLPSQSRLRGKGNRPTPYRLCVSGPCLLRLLCAGATSPRGNAVSSKVIATCEHCSSTEGCRDYRWVFNQEACFNIRLRGQPSGIVRAGLSPSSHAQLIFTLRDVFTEGFCKRHDVREVNVLLLAFAVDGVSNSAKVAVSLVSDLDDNCHLAAYEKRSEFSNEVDVILIFLSHARLRPGNPSLIPIVQKTDEVRIVVPNEQSQVKPLAPFFKGCSILDCKVVTAESPNQIHIHSFYSKDVKENPLYVQLRGITGGMYYVDSLSWSLSQGSPSLATEGS